MALTEETVYDSVEIVGNDKFTIHLRTSSQLSKKIM